MRRKTLAGAIRELADKAVERNQPMWMVRLDEPTEVLYATKADHSSTNLLAVLYSNYGMYWTTYKTDRQDVMCIRTTTPICVLGVAEEFMGKLMATLRANSMHGTYHKAGTRESYRF